jgi:hypothetical protein
MDIRKTKRCWMMKRTQKSIVTLLSSLVVFGLATTAQAQESSPPPADPPPAATSRAGGGGSGAGIGVGITQTLAFGGTGGGLALGQFVYDQAIWHIEGLLGFRSTEAGGGDDRQNQFIFGAGGWYHLVRGSSSDFSLGGVIAVNTTSGPGASTTQTAFEPGALIRAFITPNVAIFGRGGLAFVFGDTGGGTQATLGGQVSGAFGATFYFR